ncbi:peptidoglycan-binding protein [Pseudorhizobium marinum]|uniref:peptidoglycan-binding protein n=1 Tax=Pseudorhizobium marinum TaxID=1496690 RepID=UPI0004981AF0|nr:peptidoglycan-binding protein [Pseudorhizobium marinum]
MNGSRSTSPRPGDRSSLDALNRTIKGLESRIEGLMQASREPRHAEAAPLPRQLAEDRTTTAPPLFPASPTPGSIDPLQEIRNRQRMLAAAREDAVRAEPAAPPAMPRPRLERRPEARPAEPHRPVPPQGATRASGDDISLREIAEALVSLRQELKQDIADGVAQEMNALRAEVTSIRSVAQEQQIGDALRHDLARLADGIETLGHRGGPEADALRREYDELRSVLEGLAREDSLRHLDARWQGIEDRIVDFDTQELREDLVGLAYRIDDIKNQLGSMNNGPAVRGMEQKLMAIATVMEQLGSRMQPNDEALNEQFVLLADRLDEISRAIAAGSRAASASAADHTAFQRLESRIAGLSEQIDTMATSPRAESDEGLSERIEALSGRIEQLSTEEVALRLEERLEQLSQMLAQPSRPDEQSGLTEYLADISDKIDRLGHGQINEALAERLDYLARRIDEMDYNQSLQQPAAEQAAIGRIEDRLSDIAARLDETVQGPIGDSAALKSLEAQISHLSSLMSDPSRAASPEIENRVTALESYVSTNDEYIIEAARQAAEAVVDSFARRGNSAAPAMDMSALTALAEDLRQLEELTRSTEARSQHTLNALHSTLVQIADRLDTMEDRYAPAVAQQPAMQQNAAPWERASAGPVAAPTDPFKPAGPSPEVDDFHADLLQSLAGSTSHTAVRAPDARAPGSTEKDGAAPEVEADQPTVDPDGSPATMAEEEPSRQGIFTKISQRLRPGQKTVASTSGRTVVDPAPSLDPVDMLPPEREHEPLEPGSGTPDVRQILERVRASQAAAGGGGTQASVSERADYIAAARRAAKAAALETDPSSATGGSKNPGNSVIGSALSRQRRPIMMAVGAVLLAVMAIPLVQTLTSGEEAPLPPAVTQAPVSDEAPEGEADLAEATDAPAEAPDVVAGPASTTPAETTAEISPAGGPAAEDAAPAAVTPVARDTQQASMMEPRPAAGVASTLNAPAPAEAAPEAAGTAAAEPTAPAIVVPASIGPKSLTDAAEAGDPVALFEIGARYTEGRGVAVDLSEAATWYRLSADRGFPPAQYRLGNLFEKGTGIERDLDKAMTYYQQAAAAGNASAMHNLAVLNASGAEGELDYAAAADWFKKAAELGVSDSQFNLAILYARGNGTTQNLVESYKWFAIAAKGGDQDAAQKRDEVAKAMRQQDLEAARAAVEAWKPKPLDTRANGVQLPDEWAGEMAVKTSSVDMEKAIRNIQAILNKNGFDAGAPDGKMGQKTIGAIKEFQTSLGQEPTGKIDDAMVKELLARNN